MDYRKAQFTLSAASPAQFPSDHGIEVAFAGRSNAGKSSALNTLTANPRLAKTSKTPGRTQQINFFTLELNYRLVDLPGYGFAKVPKAIQMHWQELMMTYFSERQSLKGIVVLMDIRHPLTELDKQLLQYTTHYQIPTHVLLTKADKFSRGQSLAILNQVTNELLKQNGVSVQLFSALKGNGIQELIQKLNTWYYPSKASFSQKAD